MIDYCLSQFLRFCSSQVITNALPSLSGEGVRGRRRSRRRRKRRKRKRKKRRKSGRKKRRKSGRKKRRRPPALLSQLAGFNVARIKSRSYIILLVRHVCTYSQAD